VRRIIAFDQLGTHQAKGASISRASFGSIEDCGSAPAVLESAHSAPMLGPVLRRTSGRTSRPSISIPARMSA
jgi:hypothetical protein